MLTEGTLTPAYGRHYKAEKAVIEDFVAGKDFVLNHPLHAQTYCSIRDFKPGSTISLRYDKNRKQTLYKIELT